MGLLADKLKQAVTDTKEALNQVKDSGALDGLAKSAENAAEKLKAKLKDLGPK